MRAEWIWTTEEGSGDYNAYALFRRAFTLASFASARLCITADSFYRLRVNGAWVNDGPVRAYPEHYRYDALDLTPFLHEGENVLEAEVRYYGCGSFQRLPRRAGLWAMLEIVAPGEKTRCICTDAEWEATPLHALLPSVPKQSVQLAPFEWFDARAGAGKTAPAVVLSGNCPNTNLAPRDVRLLSRVEFSAKRLARARVVAPEFPVYGVYAGRWCFPGSPWLNFSTVRTWGMGVLLRVAEARRVAFHAPKLRCTLNGNAVGEALDLLAGDNLLLLFPRDVNTHWNDDFFAFPDGFAPEMRNPATGKPGAAFWIQDDLTKEFHDYPGGRGDSAARSSACEARIEYWRTAIRSLADLGEFTGRRLDLGLDELVGSEAALNFSLRRELDETPRMEHGEYALASTPECAVVFPAASGDVELCFDLGEQNCGYWEFELDAPAGTVLDLFGVEHIAANGRIQHTGDYHNGMRYVCCGGNQRYTSLVRRSARYVFLTVRCVSEPVRLRFFRLIESTYPVSEDGDFRCSDPALNEIWRISRRTLKLCMEDTFTDCPLYEQTFWIGDARNEGLFCYEAFGAYDLNARGIRLGAESLRYMEMVGCQLPSGWDALLPAWSFLWGLSVWEYYFETSDAAFLRELAPAVRKNLEGALRHIDEKTGLFRLDAWNLLEWSATDSRPEIMVYNSMLLAAALRAAIRGAEVLREDAGLWQTALVALEKAVDRAYDPARRAWPDSITDGVPCAASAVHTSMLALCHGLTTERSYAAACENLLAPRPELIKVGSPFAMFFAFEALEMLGETGRIVEAVRRDYLPMLAAGASTVWEVFPHSTTSLDVDFPTRSHCHAWSAAPLYALPRTVLGLRMTEAGARRFTVSPDITGLESASGRRPTVRGVVEVDWKQDGDALYLRAKGPEGIAFTYVPHPSHRGLKIVFNT